MNGIVTKILLLVFTGSTLAAVPGAGPAHLNEFPAVERVQSEIKGRDARDTQAKQIGAFRQLWHLVASLAPARPETPEETRLRHAYNVASGQIDRPMMASFAQADTDRLGWKSPRAQWVALCSMYENDEDLREELLTRFFSPSFRTRFARLITEGHRVQKHTRDELQQTGAGEAPQWLVDLPWYKGPACLLAAVTVLCALWLLWGLTGELKPFGLVHGSPRQLRAGRRRYELDSETGIVVNHTKGTFYHTRTTRTIDRSALNGETETSVTTRTVVHQFELAQPDGTTRLVALDHHDAELQTGARSSVVTFKRRGKEYGDGLLYYDHDRGLRTYDRARLGRIFRPRFSLLFSSLALLMCLGLYARAVRDYPPNRANFPTLFDYTGSVARNFHNIILQQGAPHAAIGLGALTVMAIGFVGLGRVRAAAFVKRDCNPLIAELDAAAASQAAVGFDRAAALLAHPPRDE